jgi:hypothetical protein
VPELGYLLCDVGTDASCEWSAFHEHR